GDEVHEHPAPERGHGTGRERADILQEKRYSRKRAVRQPVGDRAPRAVVEAADHGVDDGIAALDAFDGSIEQLGRAHLLVANQLRQTDPVIALELGEPTHARLLQKRMILADVAMASRATT